MGASTTGSVLVFGPLRPSARVRYWQHGLRTAESAGLCRVLRDTAQGESRVNILRGVVIPVHQQMPKLRLCRSLWPCATGPEWDGTIG